MKRYPIYQSGQPLVAGRSMAWRLFIIMAVGTTIALMGGFLGTGLAAQANTEMQPVETENMIVTPSAADNARDLANEVRSTVMCTAEFSDEGVCEERAADSEDSQIPVTGEE
jgi:hypothetical protein